MSEDNQNKGLIQNFIIAGNPHTFFIPSYQRGYRWSKQQVKELLDDLKEYQKKREKEGNKGLYCLQPLIVKKNGAEWEVIDGQQRLTTIYLIFKYLNNFLNKESKDKFSNFKLKYEREDIFYDTQAANWLENKEESKKDINKYFAFRAYETIKEWFKGAEIEFLKKFRETLLNQTFFIWYEIKPEANDQSKDENAIDTFTKENAGKIPMTSSELIRALLFGNGNSEDLPIMSLEWENIEKRLADDSFWYFISNKPDVATRIDIVFYCVARYFIDTCLTSKKEDFPSCEKYFSFYVINYYINSNLKTEGAQVDTKSNKNQKDINEIRKEIWEEVIKCFSILEDCYENFILYHKIGYLITVKNSKLDVYDELYQIYKIIKKDKGSINTEIDKKIKESININDISDLTYANYEHREKIYKILLLFNIMSLFGNSKDTVENNSLSVYTDCYRFPFNKFKFKSRRRNHNANEELKVAENWQLEHIHSVDDSKLPNNKSEIMKMFESIKYDIEEIAKEKCIETELEYKDIVLKIISLLEGINNIQGKMQNENNKKVKDKWISIKQKFIDGINSDYRFPDNSANQTKNDINKLFELIKSHLDNIAKEKCRETDKEYNDIVSKINSLLKGINIQVKLENENNEKIKGEWDLIKREFVDGINSDHRASDNNTNQTKNDNNELFELIKSQLDNIVEEKKNEYKNIASKFISEIDSLLEDKDEDKKNIQGKMENENYKKVKDEWDSIKKHYINGIYNDYLTPDNSIQNLALLDSSTNQTYQNSPFSYKRQFIIKREKEGQFIPLCTKNVFLKCYYDNDSKKVPVTLTIWGKKDKHAYMNEITEKIGNFFTEESKK